MQAQSETHIVVTDRDREKLLRMLENQEGDAAENLELELDRARVVPQTEVPADVVTMNSLVTYEDCNTGARRSVRLVYPRDADAGDGRVSVLAPIGCALLGLSVGQEIAWQLPTGQKRIRVVAIDYQPEAMGDLHL